MRKHAEGATDERRDTMQNHLIIAVGVFTVTYLLIMSEKVNRTAVAMVGAILMIVLNVEHQAQALTYIDYNTIGLLIGMMVIVGVMKKSGIFEYVAIRAARSAKGEPWKIVLYFSVITAIASAFLDNVTTILLIAPVTLVVCETLELNPVPFLVPEILAANIGGTATLIGDPPNIMIGSAAGLGFMDFIVKLGPIVLVIFAATLFMFKIGFGKTYRVHPDNQKKIMEMDPRRAIKDAALMKKSLVVLALTVIGFITHQFFGYESATVALLFASILLLISRLDVEDVLLEVEWPTIFFFVSLFILVGALESVGVMKFLATELLRITGGNIVLTAVLILWVSIDADVNGFGDRVPVPVYSLGGRICKG